MDNVIIENYIRKTWFWVAVAGVLILLLALITFGNYMYSSYNPGGNYFLSHWMGCRLFLTKGIDPYSQDAAQRIQTAAYGHLAQEGEQKLRFASPLFSILFFLPLIPITDFMMARALWMTLLEIALVALIFINLRLMNWKLALRRQAALYLTVLFWFYSAQALHDGDSSIWVGLLVVGALLALRSGSEELAGVLLGFTIVKLNASLLLLVFVLYWGIRQKRWHIIIWLAITVFLVVLTTSLLMPDWILQNARSVVQFFKDFPVDSLMDIIGGLLPGMGGRIGLILIVLFSVLMLFEWWYASRRKDYPAFLWTACLTLTLSQFIGIRLNVDNFILLYTPIFMILSLWEERWERSGKIFSAVTLISLFIVTWGLYYALGALPLRQRALTYLPLPFLTVIGLYWVRWWAVRPQRLWFDEIYMQENLE